MTSTRVYAAALLALAQVCSSACAAAPAAAAKPKRPSAAAPNIQPGPPDTRSRRAAAAGLTLDDAHLGVESPELSLLREAEAQMFLPTPDPSDFKEPANAPLQLPREVPLATMPIALWGAALKPTDLGARVDARTLKYLEFFKSDPRGRQVMTYWLRRRGKWQTHVEQVLAKRKLPLDLQWVALIESGLDPVVRSPAGAAGMWQFMPETCRAYGLGYTRWLDQRLDPFAQTDAAAMMLGDLYTRFGSWELALAGYNYGYGGVMQSVRHFNTTDFSELVKYESALPWETTLYVPKIMAAAIVGRNLDVFGYTSVAPEPSIAIERVTVPSGVALSLLAAQSSLSASELEHLNAQLRAKRTPPGDPSIVYVPKGKAREVERVVATLKGADPNDLFTVRFGDTLASVAESVHGTPKQISQLNDLKSDELLRHGTVLFVPRRAPAVAGTPAAAKDKIAMVVPREMHTPAGRTRVFYTLVGGDMLPDVANAFGVTVSDLEAWNAITATARLHEGMTLQVFPEIARDLKQVRYLADEDAVVVRPGTEEFFALFETKGRTRKVVVAKAGDTLAKVALREKVNVVLLERINRKGRTEVLETGKPVVLYALPPAGPAPKTPVKPSAKTEPKPDVTSTTATPSLAAPSAAPTSAHKAPAEAPAPTKDTELPPLP